MKYPEKFKALIKSEFTHYIGYGNPNAKILIIGKEPAIDRKKDTNKTHQQYIHEISDNYILWKDNCETLKGYEQLPDSYLNWCDNNPLYPYKGQKCRVRYEVCKKDENGKYIPFIHGGGGTSRTWIAYQKLYDKIVRNPPKKNNDTIDFHKYIFSSDLSDETAAKSSDTDPSVTKDSVVQRNKMFRAFPDFPIIIVASGHYPRIYGFNMEKTFNVEWDRQTLHIGQKFINIHYNKEHTRILLHTNQLSFYTNDLLDKIAEIIRIFMKKDLKIDNIKAYLE